VQFRLRFREPMRRRKVTEVPRLRLAPGAPDPRIVARDEVPGQVERRHDPLHGIHVGPVRHPPHPAGRDCRTVPLGREQLVMIDPVATRRGERLELVDPLPCRPQGALHPGHRPAAVFPRRLGRVDWRHLAAVEPVEHQLPDVDLDRRLHRGREPGQRQARLGIVRPVAFDAEPLDERRHVGPVVRRPVPGGRGLRPRHRHLHRARDREHHGGNNAPTPHCPLQSVHELLPPCEQRGPGGPQPRPALHARLSCLVARELYSGLREASNARHPGS